MFLNAESSSQTQTNFERKLPKKVEIPDGEFQENKSSTSEEIKYSFITSYCLFMCGGGGVHMPRNTPGGQRTTNGSWSPPTMWTLRIKTRWWQTPLPSESPCWLLNTVFKSTFILISPFQNSFRIDVLNLRRQLHAGKKSPN